MTYHIDEINLEAASFKGNAKAFEKFSFLHNVEEKMANRPIKYTIFSLLDFYPHLPQDLYELLHPKQHAIDVAEALHESAVAAALHTEPPMPPSMRPAVSTATARQPEPTFPPALPDDATDACVDEHERAIETWSDYQLAIQELKAFVLLGLDQEDTEVIRTTNTHGHARVSTKNIFAYIWETYGNPSPSQTNTRRSLTTAEFDRSSSLLLNLMRRFRYNEDLKLACPNLAFTSPALLTALLDLCEASDTRLCPKVRLFTERPD